MTFNPPKPVCPFCEERHDEVRTKVECDVTRARTTAGRWLIIEQHVTTAREAMRVVERELAALDVLDEAALSDELSQAVAAYKATVASLLSLDAYTALIVRLTGTASEMANAALRKERLAAAARQEAAQTANECGVCKRADVPIVGAVQVHESAVGVCSSCFDANATTTTGVVRGG